jgi:hypothetical protein
VPMRRALVYLIYLALVEAVCIYVRQTRIGSPITRTFVPRAVAVLAIA